MVVCIVRGGIRKMERTIVNTPEIRVKMKRLGLTDEMMAQKLNVSRVTYNSIINNKYRSSLTGAYIKEIYQILNIENQTIR